MSLHRHIASNDELLQLMWNAFTHGAEQRVLGGNGGRPRLPQWAIAQREATDRLPGSPRCR